MGQYDQTKRDQSGSVNDCTNDTGNQRTTAQPKRLSFIGIRLLCKDVNVRGSDVESSGNQRGNFADHKNVCIIEDVRSSALNSERLAPFRLEKLPVKISGGCPSSVDAEPMHCNDLAGCNTFVKMRWTALRRLLVLITLLSPGCHDEATVPAVSNEERAFAEQLADVRAGRSDRIVVTESRVTDGDLAMVGELPGLSALELPNAAISDRGVEELRGATNLQVLVLGETSLSNQGLAMIADLKKLQRLNLAMTDAGDVGMASLATLLRLQSLRIGSPHLTDGGLKSLADAKSLRFLILRQAPITDAGLKYLVPLKQLESLYLEGTNVTSAGERYLAETRPDLHVHFP